MRTVLLVAVALVAGCGPEFAVVPRGGLEREVSTNNGVVLTAFNNQWDADPYDLADYVTPIAIDLYNGSPYEVRVCFGDFALTDESGRRYGAVTPFEPVGYSTNERLELERGVLLASSDDRIPGVLVAARGGGAGGGGGGHFGGGAHFGASGGRAGGGSRGVFIGAPSGRRGGYGAWGGGWRGYHVAPGLRGYYGGGGLYWGYPLYYGWSPWVFAWGLRYYPTGRPSADVLGYAVPEGVLAPGGHVNGFLYFQRATSDTHNLQLTWELHEARSGGALGTTQVPLEVIKK
jgi:hypothetical protein